MTRNLTGGAPNMRGLPVPLVAVPHDVRRRESSAPAFLRRTVEELEAAEQGRPAAVVTAVPVKGKSKRDPAERGRPVTATEAAVVVQQYAEGWGLHRIALHHGRCDKTVRSILTGRGVTINGPGDPAKPLDAQVVVMAYVRDRKAIHEIAAEYRTDKKRISQILKDNRVTVARNGQRT